VPVVDDKIFIPWAAEASIVTAGGADGTGERSSSIKVSDAVKLRPEGFFEATWPSNQTMSCARQLQIEAASPW